MGHKKSKLFDEQQVMKNPLVLTFNQIQYICHHTNLIDKEVYRRYMEFLNICKDGRMLKEQFTSVLQDIWPTGNVQRFSNYLFSLCDKDKKGFMEFTDFIILKYQLNNDKSYLGLLFDMFDTRGKGYLPQEKIEPLFASMFELVGYPTDGQSGANISQQQIAHLIQVVDDSTNKRLSREEFINIRKINWVDEDSGVGTLLAEHAC